MLNLSGNKIDTTEDNLYRSAFYDEEFIVGCLDSDEAICGGESELKRSATGIETNHSSQSEEIVRVDSNLPTYDSDGERREAHEEEVNEIRAQMEVGEYDCGQDLSEPEDQIVFETAFVEDEVDSQEGSQDGSDDECIDCDYDKCPNRNVSNSVVAIPI